jgi:amino acid permease
MLVGVGVLTYFTLAVLVQGSAATGADTFSQLTKMLCGTVVMKVLQVAVLAFCFGFGVVYLVSVQP